MLKTVFKSALVLSSLAVGFMSSATAEEVVNLYSSRHYQTDEALYDNFTKQTGIKINRIEANADALIERIKSEGVNSPADILITVDAGRIWRAEQAGVLSAVQSDVLNAKIPAHLRHPDGLWFGFSSRARMIVVNTDLIAEGEITSYADLANSKYQGLVCIRSSSNIYNLSLMAAQIAHEGVEASEEWARGVVANFARKPQGGDTDQIRAVASGECAIGVANSYYFARLMASDKPEDQAVMAKVRHIFPDQSTMDHDANGTHVNISGAAVVTNAPNRANAILFLEYLASDKAQRYFADGNNECPVVEGVPGTAVLKKMGPFQQDSLNVSALGIHQAEAQRVFDRAGWK